jgi:hypothetical protein
MTTLALSTGSSVWGADLLKRAKFYLNLRFNFDMLLNGPRLEGEEPQHLLEPDGLEELQANVYALMEIHEAFPNAKEIW